MKLNFPNPARSFEVSSNCVRFWGYDSAIEVAFLVHGDALEKLCPGTSRAEDDLLDAFDKVRGQIHEAAENIYAASKQGVYSFHLTAKDV